LNFEPPAKEKINHLQVLQKSIEKITEFLDSRSDLVFLEIPRIVRIKLLIYVFVGYFYIQQKKEKQTSGSRVDLVFLEIPRIVRLKLIDVFV
jgi:hypothetical protein